MRPVPVPEFVSKAVWAEGTRVFAAPDGDLTNDRIPPAEGVFFSAVVGEEMIPCIGVVLYLEDEDIELIREGNRHIMMPWVGRRMPVFLVPDVLNQKLIEEDTDGITNEGE